MSAQSWDTIRAYTQRAKAAASDAADLAAAQADELNDAPTTPLATPSETPSETPSADKDKDKDKKPGEEKKPPSLTDRLAHLPKLPKLPTPIDGAVERASNTPTPGGIGLLVLALVVFIMAIVPVGPAGEPRLLLMWKALLGQVDLPNNAQPQGPLADLQAEAEQALQAAEHAAPVIRNMAQAAAESAINAATLGAFY